MAFWPALKAHSNGALVVIFLYNLAYAPVVDWVFRVDEAGDCE